MKTMCDLTSFTLLDLLQKAAAHKGLKLHEGYSEPIKVYELDDRLLAVLAEQNIKRQNRPDCRNEIFTLVDENPQEKVPGSAPSNYWNFKLLEDDKHKFDLRVTLSVGFSLNIEKRGIVLVPQVHGSFVSAADSLPNFRMFKALVENDEDISAVAKELAASDGSIVITWTELGLGGIRKLSHLFSEFVGRNETIARLGGEVFNPAPSDELFIAEPTQPKLVQIWRTQLKEYSAHLVA